MAALTKTDLLPTPPEYKHFVTNSTPEWLAKFPLGKVPAFEGVDGFRLTEGIAIARYCEWSRLSRQFIWVIFIYLMLEIYFIQSPTKLVVLTFSARRPSQPRSLTSGNPSSPPSCRLISRSFSQSTITG